MRRDKRQERRKRRKDEVGGDERKSNEGEQGGNKIRKLQFIVTELEDSLSFIQIQVLISRCFPLYILVI